MTRLRQLALGGFAAALIVTGAATKSFATEGFDFDNRLFGATEGLPLGAAAPPGIYSGAGSIITPNFRAYGNQSGGGSPSLLTFPSAGMAVPILWSTGYNFLGAAYSVSVVQAFYAAGSITGLTPGTFDSGTGWFWEIANTIWNPINLSWNLGNGFFVSAGFDFMAPDGARYLGNLNPDYWTFEPTLAFSYLSKSWILSVNMFYDINTAAQGVCCLGGNGVPGTANMINGNLFFADFTALYQIGKWQIGPVGFIKAQTTNDQLSGGFTCTYGVGGTCGKELAIGAGGLVGYDFGPVSFQVWVTDGFVNKDDINGLAVWWRTGFRVWAPESPKPLVAKN